MLFRFAVPALLVCGTLTSQAKTVDVATAQKVGCNYLLSENVPGVSSSNDLSLGYTEYGTVNGVRVATYYVFNFTNGSGFVMVSADDVVKPVLAFSSESSFDMGNISPEAKYWVNGYSDQITYVLANNVPAKTADAQQWAELLTGSNSPKTSARTTSSFPSSTYFLCTTKWDQLAHYNDMCPGTGSGRAVTGCVATAMAQVMKYNNWPSVGTGSHTYTAATYGALTADYGNTVYQWTSMPNTVSATNNAVAQLMLHAGISVNMNYSPTESGAYVITDETPVTNCAEYALKTYFHYKPTLRGIPRSGEYYLLSGVPTYYIDSIATSAWITLIKNELNANRPILYSGTGADGGHCWVCDGYNSTSYFHFNFGWSGTSNGFYSINNIAPPALGTGGGASGNNFNTDQCVIVGIVADSFANTTGNIKMLAHLDCPFNSPKAYGQPVTVTTKILNGGTTTFKGDFCVQAFDTNNVVVGTIQTITGQTVTAGDSTAVLTFTESGLWGLIPESYYHIECMYRPTGTTTWTPVFNNGTFINYNIIDVNNDTDILLYDSLHVTTGHNMVSNHAISVTTQIANYGSAGFNGTLEGVLINTTTGSSFTVQTFGSVSLGSGYYNTYSFANSNVAVVAGKYVFAVKHRYSTSSGNFYTTGSNYYENPVYINITSPVSVGTVATADNDIQVYPNPATHVINISLEGNEVSEIRIMDVEGRQIAQINPANQSLVSIPVDTYAPGVYFVQAQTAGGVITKKIVVTK